MSRLLLTADAVGGVWRHALTLGGALTERGWDVALAILGPAPDVAQTQEAMALGLCPYVTGLPLDWTAPDIKALRDASRALSRLAEGSDAVLLHAPSLATAPFPVPLAVTVHSCVATWWRAVRRGPLPHDFSWRSSETARGLRGADIVLAPSASHARSLRECYGPVPVQVIYNGSGPFALEDVPRQRAVLMAARLWDEGKNAALLDVCADRIDSPILAAGPTSGPNGVSISLPHLTLLGTQPRELLFAQATVFAAPSLYEPFGLAVLEAAQAGMALVLSDIPTFRELWNGAALFVPPDDPAAMAASLQRALNDPKPLAECARIRASRYTASAMADATEAALRARFASRSAA